MNNNQICELDQYQEALRTWNTNQDFGGRVLNAKIRDFQGNLVRLLIL